MKENIQSIGGSELEEQLCWSCKKAGGLCPWSNKYKPVDGWDAQEVDLYNGRTFEKNWLISGCPEYECDIVCFRCSRFNTAYEHPDKYWQVCPKRTKQTTRAYCVRCVNIYERELVIESLRERAKEYRKNNKR